MATLYLIRHGRTAMNKEKIFRGTLDVPLDEVGEAEGAATAQALSSVKFSRIITSPVSRARRTAELLSETTRAPVEVADALRDIDYGAWTRQKDEDVQQRYSDLYRTWLREPDKVRFPGGDSLDDVRTRIQPLLRDLAPRQDTVALVSHRVTLKVILCSALDLGNNYFWRFQLDTASFSRLDFGRAWRLTTLNEASHLAAVKGHLQAQDF